MIQEPKSGSGSDIPDTRSTCMTKVTGLEKCEWKEKLAAFRSDGCAVMTGTQMAFGDFFNKTHQHRTFKNFGEVLTW